MMHFLIVLLEIYIFHSLNNCGCLNRDNHYAYQTYTHARAHNFLNLGGSCFRETFVFPDVRVHACKYFMFTLIFAYFRHIHLKRQHK